MHTLSSSGRKALKARAHALKPVVMIGDAGLTPGVLAEIELSLKSHELIKIRVAGDDRDLREALLAEICAGCGAAPVQHIGKVLVVYRKREEPEPQARAIRPKRRASPPGARAAAKPQHFDRNQTGKPDPRPGRIARPTTNPRRLAGRPVRPFDKTRPKQNGRRLRSAR
jgi:RNA-binding protein